MPVSDAALCTCEASYLTGKISDNVGLFYII
jgi:hypothetical protein